MEVGLLPCHEDHKTSLYIQSVPWRNENVQNRRIKIQEDESWSLYKFRWWKPFNEGKRDRLCVLDLTSSSEVGSRQVYKQTRRNNIKEDRRLSTRSMSNNMSSSYKSSKKSFSSSIYSKRWGPMSTKHYMENNRNDRHEGIWILDIWSNWWWR